MKFARPSAAVDFNFPDLLSGGATNNRFHYKFPFCPHHPSAIYHTKNSSMFSIYPSIFHRDERGGKYITTKMTILWLNNEISADVVLIHRPHLIQLSSTPNMWNKEAKQRRGVWVNSNKPIIVCSTHGGRCVGIAQE